MSEHLTGKAWLLGADDPYYPWWIYLLALALFILVWGWLWGWWSK